MEEDSRSFSDERLRLLHEMEVERNQLVRNIETCRIRDIEHRFIDDWSLKDIVGHINSRESEVVAGFHDLKNGKPPESLDLDQERTNDWNQDHVERKRSIPFWSLYEQFHGGRERLLAEIGEVSDEDLGTEGSIHNQLARSVIDHDREHWHQIAAQLAGMGGVRKRSMSARQDASASGEGA